MSDKMRGTIKTIKHQQGFGFITDGVTGTDYFFHRSALERTSTMSFNDLHPDTPVEFTPIEGPKGARALEVRPLR